MIASYMRGSTGRWFGGQLKTAEDLPKDFKRYYAYLSTSNIEDFKRS